jgi:hypothetical protein
MSCLLIYGAYKIDILGHPPSKSGSNLHVVASMRWQKNLRLEIKKKV